VADLNDDGRPEIIINWGHIVDAFQDDGTLLWRYRTNANNLYPPQRHHRGRCGRRRPR
jgi:hypothetical protein